VLYTKMAAFWVVAPCRLRKFTDVSEVLTASMTSRPITHPYGGGGSRDL
jgi:hypothetical protein